MIETTLFGNIPVHNEPRDGVYVQLLQPSTFLATLLTASRILVNSRDAQNCLVNPATIEARRYDGMLFGFARHESMKPGPVLAL